MWSLTGVLLILAASLFSVDADSKQYVDPNTIRCDSNGVFYNLRQGDSELWAETHFNINIFTGNPEVPLQPEDFDPDTGAVSLDYLKYQVVAITTYGPNAQPLLYYIQQPFHAVPTEDAGTKRNYDWAVYCSIPAYSYVNVSANTTDDGHGDHGGSQVIPSEHYETQLVGLHDDGTVQLGDPVTYVLELNPSDTTYAALLPLDCKYYNPANPNQYLPIVSNSCPRINTDEGSYFGTMARQDQRRYELKFQAFAFEQDPNSQLAIGCTIALCVAPTVSDCYKACWGGEAPTTTAPEQTTTGGEETTTVEEDTTPEDTTPGDTTPGDTTPEDTTPEDTTPEDTTPGEDTLKRRKRDAPSNDDQPKNDRDQRNVVFRVFTEGETPQTDCPVCDYSLLPALYGVIGGLAVLTLILVIALVVLLVTSRRKTYTYEDGPVIVDGPPVYLAPHSSHKNY